MDLSVPNSTISNLAESTALEIHCQQQADESRPVNPVSNDKEAGCTQTTLDELNGSQLVIVASTSSEQIRSLNLPFKRRSAGRPKGSVNNVIGLKRKIASRVQNNKKVKVNFTIRSSEGCFYLKLF